MCGIAGNFSFTGTANKDLVAKMMGTLAHRGPDAEGFATSLSKQCVLGHRRLSIIDLSTSANQPMASACGNYAIAYNGEIYNFKEIKADIEKHTNVQWKTESDTEVILEAFALWGKQFVFKLNGMFAIAIFDMTQNILWLFRDRMGIKPLYYYTDEQNFYFASELKALLAIKDNLQTLHINKTAVKQYLRLGYIPTPNSIYNEIKKMPSASYMAVTNQGINTERYWDIRKKITPTTYSDETEAKSTLKQLLESSVSSRLVSDVPFGTFLSGGIDSSTVTAIAQHVSEKPINTFSIAFSEAKYNEAAHAKKIADHLKTNHHELTVSYQDAIAYFDEILNTYDEPFADSSAIPTMLVSKLAKKQVTMTLSGDGGDEQFMGYGAYNWAHRLENPLLKTFSPLIAWSLSKGKNKQKRASEMFRNKHKQEMPAHIFSVEQYLFSENEYNTLLKSNGKNEPLNVEQFPRVARTLSAKENQAFFDLRYYLQDDLLVKVDRASMHYSLETRVPLLDHRIVEFSINLDEKLKFKNNESKYLLKQVLYDYVPKTFFDRPKWGFSIPLEKWLKNELSYLREKYLSEEVLEKYELFNTTYIKDLEKRYVAGEDYLYNKLWLIIILNQWLETYDNK